MSEPKRTAPYTVRQLLEFLEPAGIGRASIYRAIERGEIPTVRIGAKILIPASYVQNKLMSSQ